MKKTYGMYIVFACMAIIAAQTVVCRSPIADSIEAIINGSLQRELEEATIETANIEAQATMKINKIREMVEQDLLNSVDAAQAIGKQNYIINAAKARLAALANKGAAVVSDVEEAGYLSQLIERGKAFGEWISAPLRAGYGYTKEEKDIARAIIAQLQEFKKNETDPGIEEELDEAIYQQQIIVGDVMSDEKKLKLLLGAIGVAATVAGIAYLSSGVESGAAQVLTTVVPEIIPQKKESAQHEQQPLVEQKVVPLKKENKQKEVSSRATEEAARKEQERIEREKKVAEGIEQEKRQAGQKTMQEAADKHAQKTAAVEKIVEQQPSVEQKENKQKEVSSRATEEAARKGQERIEREKKVAEGIEQEKRQAGQKTMQEAADKHAQKTAAVEKIVEQQPSVEQKENKQKEVSSRATEEAARKEQERIEREKKVAEGIEQEKHQAGQKTMQEAADKHAQKTAAVEKIVEQQPSVEQKETENVATRRKEENEWDKLLVPQKDYKNEEVDRQVEQGQEKQEQNDFVIDSEGNVEYIPQVLDQQDQIILQNKNVSIEKDGALDRESSWFEKNLPESLHDWWFNKSSEQRALINQQLEKEEAERQRKNAASRQNAIKEFEMLQKERKASAEEYYEQHRRYPEVDEQYKKKHGKYVWEMSSWFPVDRGLFADEWAIDKKYK